MASGLRILWPKIRNTFATSLITKIGQASGGAYAGKQYKEDKMKKVFVVTAVIAMLCIGGIAQADFYNVADEGLATQSST